MITSTTTCTTCKADIAYNPVFYAGRELFPVRFCEKCSEARRNNELTLRAKQSARDSDDRWTAICPPLYAMTDGDDPRLNDEVRRACLQYSDGGDGVGLGIRGPSAAGKTRLAFLLLRRLYEAGATVDAISAVKLSMLCVESYDGDSAIKSAARARLRNIRSVRYLLLDDLGKNKFTERAEVDFYDLEESRTSNLKPTIWTCNCTSDGLSRMLSEDRGEPILRRLTEFSNIVAV